MELNEVKNLGLSTLFDSMDRDDLEDAIRLVKTMLDEPWLNATNRRALSGLYYQLQVKLLAIVYLFDGYCEEDWIKFADTLSAMDQFARENSAEKMMQLSAHLQEFFQSVNEIMQDALYQADRIRDHEWKVVAGNIDVAKDVCHRFADKLQSLEQLSDDPPFGEYAFPNIKERLHTDLEEIYAFAKKAVNDMEIDLGAQLLEELLTPISEELHGFEYCPAVSESEFAYAGTIIVITPFSDELELFALSYGKKTQNKVSLLDAGALNGKNIGVVDLLFDLIAKQGNHLLIRGIERYRGNRSALLKKILLFGETIGRKVFVMDEKGDKRLYREFFELASDESGINENSIAYLYLELPGYGELVSFFEDHGMLSQVAEREIVKTYLPFAGFAGLNRAILAYSKGRDWIESARKVSEARHEDGVQYLSCLPNQSLLLNIDWGDFKRGNFEMEAVRTEINYDEVRDLNPKNIQKIVNGDYTIFEKCALVCRYCLTHGEDVSVWRDLNEHEMQKRLTQTIRLVIRILGVDLEPVVTLHDEIPRSPKAFSLCIGGGKEIQFRRSSLSNLTETMDVVCHECFHVFQAHAMQSPFCDWFWRELGVTRGRIQSWAENQKNYFGSSESKLGASAFSVYRAQVMEADARAFAIDCMLVLDSAFEKTHWE